MKKARLKINYHNQHGDWNKGTKFTNIDDYYFNTKLKLHKDYIENNPEIFEVFEEKSTEEIAGEKGFKIGDKVWSNRTKVYAGIITNFELSPDGKLRILTDNNNYRIYSEVLTNKIAIHCPTKEDFKFISKLLHPNYEFSIDYWKYVGVNNPEQSTDNFKQGNPFDLILTVEEFCRLMGLDFTPIVENKNKQVMSNLKNSIINTTLDLTYKNINRIEVIDNKGRSYVNYNVNKINLDLQDSGKTLKIFINND